MTDFDPTVLPPALPVPLDDGATDHLPGAEIPPLTLPSTHGAVDLAGLARGALVLYVHPSIGRPGRPLPAGWDATPGARGCTPQSCAFRDRYAELDRFDVAVAGLSSQSEEEQAEAAARLALPFPLVSDPAFALARALQLPTFELANTTFYKRVTLIARRGRIVQVFYPVFPPDKNAADVAAWLEENPPDA
jgi:peroxiredoxin